MVWNGVVLLAHRSDSLVSTVTGKSGKQIKPCVTLLLYAALMGQWRYSLVTDKLTATMQIAKRVYSLAQDQNDSALMIGAYRAFACTLYFSGDFETARQLRDAWCSDLALGRRTVSGRRGHRARRHLSVLSGYAPVASSGRLPTQDHSISPRHRHTEVDPRDLGVRVSRATRTV